MKYLRRRCIDCRQVFPVRKGWEDNTPGRMVEWRSDPFGEEIHGDFTKMWLCDECEYQSAMDI
jgi:hypothetical protein